MPGRVLALFAKAPVAGQVKTRLAPELGVARAAELYEAMLLDVLDQHARDPWPLALWFTPAAAEPWFAARAPPAFRLLAQRGETLAERMHETFRCHAAEGCDEIVLRGTDSPTLPAARTAEAFAALAHAPLVLCPDRDGGYNLIGLRGCAAHESLFALELSHAGVLSATLSRARTLRIACELLPGHHDVDTWADVLRLAPELDAARTPRTLACARSLTAR
jgi:hypothetical protein